MKNGPSERRRFINLELSQLDKVYLYELGEYNKALMQRNKLLKQIYSTPSLSKTLDVWDDKLVEYGSKIISSREKFIEKLSGIAMRVSENLTGNREHLELVYEPDVTTDYYSHNLKRQGKKIYTFYLQV